MKTKEELDSIKKDVVILKGKLAELTEEELAEVSGGFIPPYPRSGASGSRESGGGANGENTDLDPVWNPSLSAVNEKDEQKINAGNCLRSSR